MKRLKSITKEEIHAMWNQTIPNNQWRVSPFGNWDKETDKYSYRKVNIFYSNSYDSDQYGCIHFYVEGSPARIIGFIAVIGDGVGLRMSYVTGATGKTKTFYFDKDYKRSTYDKLMY